MNIVKPIFYLLKDKKMVNLTALYTKESDGGYTVEILELPGCVSYGKNMEEAQLMIKEAAAGYLEAQKKI
jgi:predicted RNase H-like HicB family nuclease